ncbi:hypothetical protein BGW36DRAFT_376866 [Talaromyces proteolyticus]|uniref:Zn(2)-C6 fungal-type domain-containing protein n=1 Tax=Talaromyces proteolyticus TaxID=1131652 RepID=A0AAD4PZB9_9EURO|nr:uncharacterized protein BGW36DRAFT_376866 [Talaromyces proteolyticus]KAH8698861.1 hypothetical protein BGW36DRAFT_376866 [Talaromyces proteolyticus]
MPSRIKSCVRCRQQKLRCDAYQRSGRPCSRCKRMRMDCVIVGAYDTGPTQTRAELTQEIHRLNKQLSLANRATEGDGVSGSPSMPHHSLPSLGQTTNGSLHIPRHHVLEDIPLSAPAPATNDAAPLLRSREQFEFTHHDIARCFSRFSAHYSGFLPGIFDQNLNQEAYINQSPFLFWSIVATGARNLRNESHTFRHAAKEIRNLEFSTLFNITNPIPAIQAALILCLWPIPMETMWKDPSHAFAGAAYSLAVQHGLYAAGHEQDFRRTQIQSNEKERKFWAHLWLHCCLNFQSTSLCDGLPFFSIPQPRLSQRDRFLNLIDDPALLYRYRCHKMLCNAIVAISESIDMENQDDNGLSSLVKVFNQEIESVPLPENDELCFLTQCCARLAIMSHFFFIQIKELKSPGIITVFSIATETLDIVSRLDITRDFAYYATHFYLRMTLLAAFCIIRVIRSGLREHINLRDAEQSLFKAIAFVKKRSIQPGDLDERYAIILTQLWTNSGAVNRKADFVDGLNLRIRSRSFMSIVFDSLWWWRMESNGQSNPYESGGTAQNQNSLLEIPASDGPWCDPSLPLSENLEYLGVPSDGLIDWNWPSNLPFPFVNVNS